MAGLQLDHASLVMKAMQLRSTMRPQAARQASAEALAASTGQDAAGFAAVVMVLERVFAELEAHLTQPSVTDWAVLMVGYVVLGCLAMAGMSFAPCVMLYSSAQTALLVADPSARVLNREPQGIQLVSVKQASLFRILNVPVEDHMISRHLC